MPSSSFARLQRLVGAGRSLSVSAAVLLLMACGGAATDAVTDPPESTGSGGGNSPSQTGPSEPVFDSTQSFVRIVSDPGEYVGQGKTFLYTPANAIILVK